MPPLVNCTEAESPRTLVTGQRSKELFGANGLGTLLAIGHGRGMKMAVTVIGGVLLGVDAHPIEIEVDLLRRLPGVSIVGLAASSVREAAERIRSAVSASGLEFPRRRVVVNLAPADLKKDGTLLELPMALGLLAADEQIPRASAARILAAGELSLGGDVRPIRGAASLALLARKLSLTLLLPSANASEAAMVVDADVRGVRTLGEAVAFLRGELDLPRAIASVPLTHLVPDTLDLAEVRGQTLARRALEIAAAGAHHLLLVGPPGCGKSMLAKRLPSILPPMTMEEALESSRVYSAAGLLAADQVGTTRPFRAPHHTVSCAGMVGDRNLRPGELALAHLGVLFLDEAPEFGRSTLEALRQPLEDGVLRVTRAKGTVTWPSKLTLILAANPCPCGQRGGSRPCRCGDGEVDRYLRRLSGPILDRIDLHVEVQPVPSADLLSDSRAEASIDVRARVVAARKRQHARGQQRPNGQLSTDEARRVSQFDDDSRKTLENGARRLGLTGRAMTRVIKVARTIADLHGDSCVDASHLRDALMFRAPTSSF